MSSVKNSRYSAAACHLSLNLQCIETELHVKSAIINEGVNQLFEAHVDLSSPAQINPETVIGSMAEIEFALQSSGEAKAYSHYFSGVITEIHSASIGLRGCQEYRITLQPEHSRLNHSSDYRIWQNMNAIEVLEALTKEYNFSAPDIRSHLQPPQVSYSVQHGETDLNYLIRRLQEAGLFWWFIHEKGKHRFCVGDDASSWLRANEWPDGKSHFDIEKAQQRADCISSWQETFRAVPYAHAGGDWNFKTPHTVLTACIPTLIKSADYNAQQLFDFPAGAQTVKEIEQTQKLRMQAEEAGYCKITAHSNLYLLASGRVFTPVLSQDKTLPNYVITEITHQITASGLASGEGNSSYNNKFIAIPAKLPATPVRTLSAPHVDGTQIAIVAGPENETIHCDRFGRIKLWFPWDRRARKDGSDTCWVRVAQIWGGENCGSQIIPRVGMEVIVSYLNGNPDRPVVVGVISNPRNMPIYKLPDNKTRLTIRSQSYRGNGFNELALDDCVGKENLFTHAQKSRTETVGASDLRRIKQHSIVTIGGNQFDSIMGSRRSETLGSAHIAVGACGNSAKSVYAKLSSLSEKTAKLLKDGAMLSMSSDNSMTALAHMLQKKNLGLCSDKTLQVKDRFLKDQPGTNAGETLAELGTQLGSDIDSSFSGDGEQHTLIGKLRSDSIGQSCVEQVACGKVLHVGDVFISHVGNEQITTAGKKLTLLSGELTDIESKIIEIFANDSIRLSTPGGYIELNGSGIVIHGLKIDIHGNSIDFQQGGAGKGAKITLPTC